MSEEELINYFQEKIYNGNHKIFSDVSDNEYKTIDALNCIKQLQQENKELKNKINGLRNNMIKDISVIKTLSISKEEIIQRLEENVKIIER
jgi:hypothetical protein